MASNTGGRFAQRAFEEPIIEEIVEEEPAVAAEEEEDDEDSPGNAPGSEYSGEYDDDPMQQISQLLLTEDGEAVADVLQGIRDAMDKQNKILFKLVGILGAQNA